MSHKRVSMKIIEIFSILETLFHIGQGSLKLIKNDDLHQEWPWTLPASTFQVLDYSYTLPHLAGEKKFSKEVKLKTKGLKNKSK